MSGTPKKGLDYAPWDTNIFENDTKIDELIDAQGWTGFAVYFYLCQKAYASDGYFYRWSYANAATTARRMGGGIGSENVKQVVSACLRIGLFEKRLFDVGGVLTSKGIQRRYMEAVCKRRVKDVDPEIWLLDESETKNVQVLSANSDLLPANGYSLSADAPKSKVKESKEKESKEKSKEKGRFLPPSRDAVRAYARERNSDVDPDRFFDYFDTGNWIDSKGQPVRNWKQKFITWENQRIKNSGRGEIRNAGTGSNGNSAEDGYAKWGIKPVPLGTD